MTLYSLLQLTNLWPSGPDRIGILEMLVFEEREELKKLEKKPLGARTRANNKLNPHMKTSRTRATLVGGECSHHCAIPDLSPKNQQQTQPTYTCIPSSLIIRFQMELKTVHPHLIIFYRCSFIDIWRFCRCRGNSCWWSVCGRRRRLGLGRGRRRSKRRL